MKAAKTFISFIKIHKTCSINEKKCISDQFLKYFFTFLIGPEVADAWYVSHPNGIHLGDTNVMSNLT